MLITIIPLFPKTQSIYKTFQTLSRSTFVMDFYQPTERTHDKVICISISSSFADYDIHISYKEEYHIPTCTAEEAPGTIVRIFAKASDLFKERRSNFCSNGDRSLEEVLSSENHDSEAY